MFYYIQRLTRKATSNLHGLHRIDDLFDFDYMGSAEFEFGAIPRAYRRMISFNLSIHPVELTRNGITHTVYFIASDDAEAYEDLYDDTDDVRIATFDQAINCFQHWFQQPHLRVKEATYFDMRFEDSIPSYMREYPPKIDTWWALDENIAWTLDENIAQDLLEVLNVAPLPVKK